MADVIRIENLRKEFGSVVGVADISLSIESGEFVTLLGPSGCGKSTLLRMIGGFEAPTRGTIWLDGEDVTDLPPNQRAVNMVFQDYALFPHMTVGKNIAYGLRVSGVPSLEMKRRVKDALALVGLSEKESAYPSHLSGGQRQRVSLARAIVRRPKVLLLDEPLSALDANLREQMQVELKSLHDQIGLTFVMVTHDQSEGLVMSDRVIVMRDGRITQSGDPVSLYDKPNSRYVAGFIGTTNIFTSRVEKKGNRIYVSCFGQELEVEHCVLVESTEGEQVFGFRPEKATLFFPGESRRTDGVRENILNGVVESVLYHGSSIRVSVKVGEASLLVDVLMSDSYELSKHASVGDSVCIKVDAHKIMPLSADRS